VNVEPTVLTSSRAKQCVFLCISLASVAIALLVPSSGSDSWATWRWACGIFFGLGVVVFAISLLRPHRLFLDGEGFTITGGVMLKSWRYSWTDIERFKPFQVSAASVLVGFDFCPAFERSKVFGPVNRALGVDAALPGSWPMPTARMVEFLNDYRDRALGLKR